MNWYVTRKKIILGITGSIAAYKANHLVRLFVKAGAEVKVMMTPAAKDFVSTLTLSTLSRNFVLVDMFDEQSWANHVMLGRWADIMLIAPLSCNTLAKMAMANVTIFYLRHTFLPLVRLWWRQRWMKICGNILQQRLTWKR